MALWSVSFRREVGESLMGKYFLMYGGDFIREILSIYLEGVPINSIGVYMELPSDEINFIIDHYSPYL